MLTMLHDCWLRAAGWRAVMLQNHECHALFSYLLLLDEQGVGGFKVCQASLAVLQIFGGSVQGLASRADFSLLQGAAVRK